MRTVFNRSALGANRIAAALLLVGGLMLCSSPARAQDNVYAKIGWWEIRYKEFKDMNGCDATAQFQDQTTIQMALIQIGTEKSWTLFLHNPDWTSKLKTNLNYTLFLIASKPWHGTFSVNDDKSLYEGDLSIEFMNSIADAASLIILDEDKHALTARPLNMKDSADAIKAVVRCVREHAPVASSPEANSTFSGTGFFVAPNLVVTNNHVVKACTNPIQVRYPERTSYTATISGQDNTNDLALLHTDMDNLSVVSFHIRPRLGEAVAVYGFPYADVLSSSGNFTVGNVTSLSGMGDDTRFLQISAPVQPGNSGGPLLDMSGRVVGVVVGQLNALAMMQAGNSVPQNVNFAIQVPIVINFLSVKGVAPKLDAPGVDRTLPPSDVADIAKQFTVQLYCQGISSKTSEGEASVSARSDVVYLFATKFRASASQELGDLLGPVSERRLLKRNWQQMNCAR